MTVLAELAKLPAFMRRDLRIATSYRMAAATEALGLAVQALVFAFIGKLVDPSRLPTFGGTRATYMEFVVIGIAVNLVVVLMLHQVAAAMRNEQLIGTLESLLATPTKIATIQAGSAMFQLLFVPLRLSVFVALIGLLFGLDFHVGGVLPALTILLAFLPFVWGLGLVTAAAVVTFRRGIGGVAVAGTVLGLASGAFFPLALLPHWLQGIARFNPVAVAIGGMRETLIGGVGWAPAASDVLKLVPLSVVALAVGGVVFQLGLKRERRLGTLGLY
jgi:ABC-2 type transport system permease protein